MVLVAVPFMVLSDNAPVELCLRLLIHFQKGLELLVIRLSPMAFRCSLTFVSGSSSMSLLKPWNIGIKADHLIWDILFHCSSSSSSSSKLY